MTWNAFHRRGDVLANIIKTIDSRADGHLPLDLPGVSETFRDDLDVISALTLKWNARLSCNIERALHAEPMDLESAVAAAWRATCEQLPGIRRVVDHYTAQPTSEAMGAALATVHEKERIRLALSAGLANYASPEAAAVGRRVEDKARFGFDLEALPAPYGDDDEATPSLVARIRALVA